ncbi:MAG: FAD-dependent oxidoreductase [Kineosporiaceae bacterium]
MTGPIEVPRTGSTVVGDVVVGGGILGLAVARALTERTGEPVTVLEKEDALARHQTGRNSGVVHAGLYYLPGSLKATLCRRGVGQLRDFCAEHQVPYLHLGKVVVATTAAELPALAEVERRARAGAVPGLRRLDPAGLADLEPAVAGVAAVHSPTTAVTDFSAVTQALADQVTGRGGTVHLGTRVVGLRETASGVEVRVRRGTGPVSPGRGRTGPGARRGPGPEDGGGLLRARRVLICAGLQADLLARAAAGPPYPRVVPFRGEYHRLIPSRRGLVHGLVYPVPDARYPFLGVHVTPRVDGEVLLGPNAVLALAREGYRRRDVEVAEVVAALTGSHLRGLARRHWRTGARELAGSLLRPVFLHRARQLLPGLRPTDLRPAPAGVRAQAVDSGGRLLDDFAVEVGERITVLRNAPSPAATSALAVAEYVLDRIGVPGSGGGDG